MATYTGKDKRLKYLFAPAFSTSEQPVGKWIDGSDLFQRSYSVQITNATSTDEVIADLSGLGFDYAEIVRANLVTSSGAVPIFANLKINGTDLEYTGAFGTGTAYFTIQYTMTP
ncbi:MAG: hypothetical protein J6X14_00865 [Lachnospiraceae bacterium]|nr:hypothetical protein [Lachnospiraceae bacterium]MBP5668844.1 hypothetical protein [Lachnospiraceae bacterium]